MQLHEHLKQLKSIEPDRDYTRRSRLAIIGDNPMPLRTGWRHVLVHNLQFGAAIAVMAAVFMIVMGGSYISSLFNPFQGTAFDVSSLKAEAQDVDIQIELAKMSYPQTASRKAVPSPTAIKKISEVVVDNKKDIEDLKQTNAELSQPALMAAKVAPSTSTTSTDNGSSSIASNTSDTRIMGFAPMMATTVTTSTATSTETSTAPTASSTEIASTTATGTALQASTSVEITPDQLLDQLAK